MLHHVTRVFTLAEDLAGERSPRFWRGLWLGALEAVFGAVPYVCLYMVLVDLFHGQVTLERAAFWTGVMFLGLALQIVVGVRAMTDVMIASYALFGATRMRLADHVRKLPMGWMQNTKAGALVAVFTTQLNLLSEIWSHFIGYFSGGVAIPVCVGFFLLTIDVRLGLVTMATLPLAFLLLAVALVWMQRLIASVIPVNAEAEHQIVEYVRGIQVLRVFGRFGDGFARLERALAAQRDALIRVEVLPAPLLGSYGATIDAGYALLVYVGAWLWIEGTLQPEVLLLFIVVSLKFFQPLFDLGVSILLLRFGQQALERTEAILGTPILPEPSAPQVPTGAAIQFSEVSFRYQDAERPALDKVNAQMPERSLTAIVGASGSGKSTMVHLIARLWDIEEGSITMGGVDLRDMTTAELHRQITMVFQDVTLFNGTVRENVLIGKPDATDAELEQAARAAQAHDFIMGLPQGYDTPIGGEGARLSGGEKQRLSIARALLKNAPIVLLDEATASIDPAAEIHIQRAIDALVRERTVVVIAHRLRTIARAHHILVLHEGRLVEAGSHHQLLERDDRYAALWKAQARQRDGSETPKGD